MLFLQWDQNCSQFFKKGGIAMKEMTFEEMGEIEGGKVTAICLFSVMGFAALTMAAPYGAPFFAGAAYLMCESESDE